ncbi:DUF1682 multi-domain protein [Pyrenophora tritici-repentis]|nr:DUF1682 multi-domain protein [Pyrenophora tritici-repentis]
MPPKRQRKPKQPFDQGVNPSSQKRRAPATRQNPTHLTPKRVRREALPSPPATAPPRRQSPLSEPELQATQTAASAQAEDIVGEDEDTFEDGDGDPLPEDEDEIAAKGAAGSVEDEGEPAYRRQEGTPWLPRSSQALEDEVNPVLRVRWRACLGGDMEKHFIPEAADSEHGVRLYSLHFDDLWQWVDDVVAELRPKRAKISSVCTVVYPAKQAKRERAIKRLRRGVDATWNSFQRLVVEVDNYVSEPVNVDFELILAEIPGEQQPLPTVVDGPRRRTATVIQEEGLAGVIAAEQAGSGHAVAIRDRWRCTDTHCENYPYCCWMAPTARQPARFEDHLFVNGNIISMWARAITARRATYDEPSDDVRLAILRAKDLRVHEKTRKLRAAGDGDDDIKSLTKLLIVGQLERMNRQPQQESNLQAAAPTITRAEVSSASQWAPIRYDHEQEINEHTSNFFNYLKLKFPTVGEDINELYKTLVIDGAMDINLLMQPSGDILKLWTQHFKQPPGWFFTLQNTAKEWQAGYQGLTDRNWRRVERCKKREEIARKKLYEARKLRSSVHHLSVQYELLKHENEGLKEALQHKKKHRKKGKALDLQQRQEYHGGSVFWSPRKLREARAREAVRERDETEEKLQKARSKKQREEARLQRQDELEERRVERQRLKEMRELERAEKAAERARQKEERDAAKAIQLPQKGKRRASAATSSNNKRQKRVEAARAGAQVQEEPPAPPSKLTSRGRNVNLPSKYR